MRKIEFDGMKETGCEGFRRFVISTERKERIKEYLLQAKGVRQMVRKMVFVGT